MSSQSFFQRTRNDPGSMSGTISTKVSKLNGMSVMEKGDTGSGAGRPRAMLGQLGKSNTLSVFEPAQKSLTSSTLIGAPDARKMSIMNVRIVSNRNGLPEFFDVNKVKQERWMDSKTCQLCDIKFTLRNGKHHCRRCGRCVCSRCSMQIRQLSCSDTKKYRVCDRCDLKLDNTQFENTYRGIIKAELDIMDMHEQKKREFDKKIDEAESQILKQRNINAENESKRLAEKTEFNEKVENAYTELKYLNRSKNYVTKNIKNEDERIESLNQALDKLRNEKFMLTQKKTMLQHEAEDLEDMVRNVDPEFVRSLNISIEEAKVHRNSLTQTQTTSNTRSAIDETRSQMRNFVKENEDQNEGQKEFDEFQGYKPSMGSDEEEEDEKNEPSYHSKPNKDASKNDLSVVQERESEYFGSNITNTATGFGKKRLKKGTSTSSNFDG